MGFDFTDWASVEGAMFMGAGGSEFFWFAVSAGCCVFALVVGLIHEKSAYRRHR